VKIGRKVTNGPRVYMAGDTVDPAFRYPVVIEVVVEGEGHVEAGALAAAAEAASRANPGTRLVARGRLHWTRLKDTGVTPPVRRIVGAGWSGRESDGLPFYRYPLPLRTGPTCDVILMTGPPTRIMFRGHHAVIDGQGLMMWITDVFRALRGETPVGSGWTESVDQYRRNTPEREPKWTGGHSVAPTGNPRGRTSRVSFFRVDLPGPISALMPRLMLLAAQSARRHNPSGRIVFGVPISLRRRKPEVRSSSNLSRAVYVDLTPLATTIADIDRAVHQHAEYDGQLAFTEALIPFLPLWLLRRALEKGFRRGFSAGRYWVSGIVSNFGRFKRRQFSAPGFTPRALFSLPPSSCLTPVFFILLGLDDAISISASMPESLASGGRLEAFMEYIRRGLSPDPAHVSGRDLEHSLTDDGRLHDLYQGHGVMI
jgi:hypothetical protein